MYATFYSVEYPLVPQEEAVTPEGTVGKVDRLIKRENSMALNDSGVVCKFSRNFTTTERDEVLFDADFSRLLAVRARIVTLERHFNNQRGFDREDDRLPYELPEFDTALDEYYEGRGCCSDGVVPQRRISE
ncbi:hypothetical protein DV707_16585 (plasmid) [Halobellus limi]|uniref:Aldehyde ferredoxin oxidoreductase C-terminal domain-containing protein n=1 Tax=Halobellus limi TaxID=699433 RepID=A0A4D6H6S0_9EURY|nr:hypothetical protein DV707_16585 [Halobellus limi]